MADREKVIRELKAARLFFEMGSNRTDGVVGNLGCKSGMKYIDDAFALLKEQEAVVRCKDCENWIPGYITYHDDFIPPKCGKYQQMVGHSADDYCSLAERKEGR